MATSTQPAGRAAPAGPPRLFGRYRFWLIMVGLTTLVAGLLFGYDQGVISGALPLITAHFDLSATMSEVVTSWVTLGALVGALVAGVLADNLGRRRTLMLAGLLFMFGAAIEAFAPSTAVLVVGRFVVGFGVGVASVAAPLYAAEMAPAATRGRFVSLYQLAITIGILVADIVDDLLTGAGNWRLMLGLAIVPGFILIVLVWRVPESPRWLVRVGRRHDAESALRLVEEPADIEPHLRAVESEVAQDQDQASWGELFAAKMRRPLMVGIGLSVFQQITGINAIIYYSSEIFAKAGFTTPQQQARATLYAVGVVNVLATLIAVAYVDRFGRRPLLLAGLVGMTVSCLGVGIAFIAFDETATAVGPSTVGLLTVLCVVVFIASFAFSLGPVVWTVINEIYPSRVRGRAVALATAANWGAAFLVSEFFLTIVDAIGTAGAFFLFALASVIGYVWIHRNVPETKGLSLEQVTELFDHDDPVAQSLAAQGP
jgi:sugar porter (SP) family MFS transporter